MGPQSTFEANLALCNITILMKHCDLMVQMVHIIWQQREQLNVRSWNVMAFEQIVIFFRQIPPPLN